MTRLLALGLSLALLAAAPALAAHAPNVEVEVDGAAYARTITVHVRTASGRAVRRAEVVVSAAMHAPGHFMSVVPKRATRTKRGVYRARLQFPMLGAWTLLVRVERDGARPLTRRLTIGL